MKQFKFLAFISLCLPILASAQFGPKKRDLQLSIDTLELRANSHDFDIEFLKSSDSVINYDIKRLANELKDLKNYLAEVNANTEKLRIENENFSKDNQKLKKQYTELLQKVEIQQILIRNIIGGDSIDQFEKEIQEENKPKTEVSPEVKNFSFFANEFLAKVKREGESAIVPYLSSTNSFFYLSKPGFITSVSEIKDANELGEEIPWRVGLDAFKKTKYSLVEGEKPEVNCDMADFYNKLGIYGGLESDFDKVSKALLALKEFSPDEDTKLNSQIDEIKRSEKTVVSFIYSTDGNLGFYFIKENGTWKLFCIEVEDPCSA